ncbi:hypothetical protein NUU61_002581 [Penicillium alfredii]|uniref:Uncharacterized protein n=1 Tax=Penicillium alfredii TaxID=1506179 RepID=A0A9W9FRT4_9EURO|nr:uncharacterized protein NUU61_002581 [Penicillium alfredii]KAJ5105234.1 hypothetical protein NUU61_002581 [Penicillium alfredii]
MLLSALLIQSWITLYTLCQLVAAAPTDIEPELDKRVEIPSPRMSPFRGWETFRGQRPWEPPEEHREDVNYIAEYVLEFAKQGYANIGRELQRIGQPGNGVVLVAALYVPGNGVWISSKPRSKEHGEDGGSKYIFENRQEAPKWNCEMGRYKENKDQIHAEDGAIFFFESTHQRLARGDIMDRGYPKGSYIAIWGKSKSTSTSQEYPPCSSGSGNPVSCLTGLLSLHIANKAHRSWTFPFGKRDSGSSKSCDKCKKCPADQIPSKDCKSCQACPKNQKPDASKKKCIPTMDEKDKEKRYQATKKKKIEEYKKSAGKEKEKRYQEVKNEKRMEYKDAQAKKKQAKEAHEKKSRMGKCLTVVPLMMDDDSALDYCSNYFDHDFVTSDDMLQYWPSSLSLDAVNTSIDLDSDDFINPWMAEVKQKNDIAYLGACGNPHGIGCKRSYDTIDDVENTDSSKNTDLAVPRGLDSNPPVVTSDLVVRETELAETGGLERRQFQILIEIILAFLGRAVPAFLRLTSLSGRLAKLATQGRGALSIAKRGQAVAKDAKSMADAAKSISKDKNWEKCLKGEKPS